MKNSCVLSNPKKIFVLWTKKNSYKEMLTKNIHAAQKFPISHNFSNGPSLTVSGQ